MTNQNDSPASRFYKWLKESFTVRLGYTRTAVCASDKDIGRVLVSATPSAFN